MTDISNILTQLDDNKVLFAQVIAAVPGGFDLPATSAQEISTLLENDFADAVYSTFLPADANWPNVVYRLSGVDTFETDGYRLLQTDMYTLIFESKTGATTAYAQFDANMRAIISRLRTSAYSIEPVDMRVGYDDEKKSMAGEIDIEFTWVIDAAGAVPGDNTVELPAALVYAVGRSAEESEFANLVKQVVTDQYGIVIITAGNNIPALIAEIQANLLGFSEAAHYWDAQYVSGANLGGVSTMELWREIYTTRHHISE